jgi:3'-5' exoribonuclease
MPKKQFIAQCKEKDRLDDIFLVKSARLAETRAGKPFLTLEFADSSGEISGPVWDQVETFQALCPVGAFIHLTGAISSYQGKLQVKVDNIQSVAPDTVDLADFLPASAHDRVEMAARVQVLIASVSNPFLKKLLARIFKKDPPKTQEKQEEQEYQEGSDSFWRRFQEAPAAKGIHHAYLGGLLEHSLSVATLAGLLADHYPGVDRSLLVAGALLHDIGKVDELAMELAIIDYTPQGRLKGHLVMGSELVAGVAAKIKDFPPPLLMQLQHLILSHHGRQEFGSPTVPMTVEAFLLSGIDDMDAKMNLMEQLRKKMSEPGLHWTEYQRTLERYLYLGPFEEREPEPMASAPERRAVSAPPSPQPGLFEFMRPGEKGQS